jgi:hypothetical protein
MTEKGKSISNSRTRKAQKYKSREAENQRNRKA